MRSRDSVSNPVRVINLCLEGGKITPNLDFNPVFTKFNSTDLHQGSEGVCSTSREKRTSKNNISMIISSQYCSILWHKSLQPYVQKVNDSISTDRVVGIRLVIVDHPICFPSVYLPTRTGCTDDFKECIDYLDAVLDRLSFDNDVIIMGDLNADPGSEGGPLSSTSANEQGRILLHYLQRWNYLSVHSHDEDPGLLRNVMHWSTYYC